MENHTSKLPLSHLGGLARSMSPVTAHDLGRAHDLVQAHDLGRARDMVRRADGLLREAKRYHGIGHLEVFRAYHRRAHALDILRALDARFRRQWTEAHFSQPCISSGSTALISSDSTAQPDPFMADNIGLVYQSFYQQEAEAA